MAETVVTDEALCLVQSLPEPTRWVWAVVTESVTRVVLVDEDEAEDIARAERSRKRLDGEVLQDLLDRAKEYESEAYPIDFASDARIATWEKPDEDVDQWGPKEACPHCGGTTHYANSPEYADHERSCPLHRHYVGLSRVDWDANPHTRAAYCSCGWTGPARPEEEDEHGRLTHEYAVQLDTDAREHLAGRVHGGHVRRDLGLPDMPAEHGCWRPVPGVEITHLIPREAPRG